MTRFAKFARRTPLAVATLLLAGTAVLAQPAPTAAGAPVAPPPAGAQRPDGPGLRPPAPDKPGGAAAPAPTPAPPAVNPRRAAHGPAALSATGTEATVTLTGRVQQLLLNPNGEIDGLLLDDGTQVAVAPHLSARLLDTVQPRDTVQVSGLRGAGGAGNTPAAVLRAQDIRNTASGRSVRDEPPAVDAAPPAPPAPRAPAALAAMSASGRIRTLLHNHRGDVDGVLLDDGTAVRFPPHVGAAMAADLQAGSSLYARGYGTRNAQGTAFAATRLGRSEATARDVFTPPGGAQADARGALQRPAAEGAAPPAATAPR